MDLLLQDRLAPITNAIGFVDANFQDVVRVFVEAYTGDEQQLARGTTVVQKRVMGNNLEQILTDLLPLTTGEIRRHILIPTKSAWVAYFNNAWRGGDLAGFYSYMPKRLGCQSVAIRAAPHTLHITSEGKTRGRYGICELGLYTDHTTIRFGNEVRLIRAMANDNGRFEFFTMGEPLSFEDVERYKVRRVRDRFTFEMLRDYAAALGLRPFDEDFYLPEGSYAVLIEKQGYVHPQVRELSLEEARAHW